MTLNAQEHSLKLKSGIYLIPTPIGNLGDITLRALETLKAVDIVYCEDTRVTGRLLSHFGIKKRLKLFSDVTENKNTQEILNDAQQLSIAIVSDAGTPLISDPGYKLIKEARDLDINVVSLPGACAAIVALTLSAMPTDQFMFCGFYSSKKAKQLVDIPSTLIFYEAPHRILKTLTAFDEIFPNRSVSIHREITKLYEQNIVHQTGSEIAKTLEENNQVRGEFVIVLSPPAEADVSVETIIAFLHENKDAFTSKDLIKRAADKFNEKKQTVYALYTNHVREK
jgi:16S rRNA (cytidine1402-2'-O)-methyltransferase